jgi:hypothetical protein
MYLMTSKYFCLIIIEKEIIIKMTVRMFNELNKNKIHHDFAIAFFNKKTPISIHADESMTAW